MKKQIDMSAFVGKDFDCEFGWGRFTYIGLLVGVEANGDDDIYYDDSEEADLGEGYPNCRPRLNKPQVLDDWLWVPDGLLWEVQVPKVPSYYLSFASVRKRCVDELMTRILWASCVGVEPDYKEWGEQHGMEVIEL